LINSSEQKKQTTICHREAAVAKPGADDVMFDENSRPPRSSGYSTKFGQFYHAAISAELPVEHCRAVRYLRQPIIISTRWSSITGSPRNRKTLASIAGERMSQSRLAMSPDNHICGSIKMSLLKSQHSRRYR
jgi:hypothetical protein